MDKGTSKNVIIILLVGIIIMLVILFFLVYTGKVEFSLNSVLYLEKEEKMLLS